VEGKKEEEGTPGSGGKVREKMAEEAVGRGRLGGYQRGDPECDAFPKGSKNGSGNVKIFGIPN